MFWHVSVHQSVCPHLGKYPGEIQVGGTPARPNLGYPCQRGYPNVGVPWPGGTPPEVPHLGYPLSDLAGGYLNWRGTLMGGYPTSATPPVRLGWVGYPDGGYPTSDNRWSTWYAAVGMPLAFTKEDFLISLEYYFDLQCVRMLQCTGANSMFLTHKKVLYSQIPSVYCSQRTPVGVSLSPPQPASVGSSRMVTERRDAARCEWFVDTKSHLNSTNTKKLASGIIEKLGLGLHDQNGQYNLAQLFNRVFLEMASAFSCNGENCPLITAYSNNYLHSQ